MPFISPPVGNSFAGIAYARMSVCVDRLAKRKKKVSISRADSIRVLLLVIVVAGVPILGIGTVFVTTSTSEPDLSELTPISPRAGQYLVLDWSALLQNEPRVSKTGTVIPAEPEVQALGYMMDGDRSIGKNQWVQDCVLLPKAGTVLHPAHRSRDQAIAVHLKEGTRIQFSPRTLVWVWGNLQASSGLGPRAEALYTLGRARAKPDGKADIQGYFK